MQISSGVWFEFENSLESALDCMLEKAGIELSEDEFIQLRDETVEGLRGYIRLLIATKGER